MSLLDAMSTAGNAIFDATIATVEESKTYRASCALLMAWTLYQNLGKIAQTAREAAEVADKVLTFLTDEDARAATYQHYSAQARQWTNAALKWTKADPDTFTFNGTNTSWLRTATPSFSTLLQLRISRAAATLLPLAQAALSLHAVTQYNLTRPAGSHDICLSDEVHDTNTYQKYAILVGLAAIGSAVLGALASRKANNSTVQLCSKMTIFALCTSALSQLLLHKYLYG